ncbi:MAG: hypothetical protein K5678_02165 [Acetatifactor sp.]|nr:hypothetical protein [Acetatifactor sp.]
MTIEKMNEEIEKLEDTINQAKKKRDELVDQRDREIMRQTQKVLARHHVSMNELLRLKNASEEELKAILKLKEETNE